MEGEYNTVLVAVDGSKQSMVALQFAINIAKRNDAKLVLGFAIGDNNVYLNNTYKDGIKKVLNEKANEILTQCETIVKEADHSKVERAIDYGVPKEVIANNFVEDYQVDLLILGATGVHAGSRFTIGSTAEYVVRHANCHVLIAK